MKTTFLAFWAAFKEILLGSIFVVACLASGAAILTAIFGGGYSIKIGPKFYDLPENLMGTLVVAGSLWAVFGVLYLIRIIYRKYAKN